VCSFVVVFIAAINPSTVNIYAAEVAIIAVTAIYIVSLSLIAPCRTKGPASRSWKSCGSFVWMSHDPFFISPISSRIFRKINTVRNEDKILHYKWKVNLYFVTLYSHFIFIK
jgi:hypothetical protein